MSITNTPQETSQASGINSPTCARIPIDQRSGLPMVTNQMKADCIGEFEFTIEAECTACFYDEPDSDCEVCQGGIQYERKVTVPWDTCKEIFKRMAAVASRAESLAMPDLTSCIVNDACWAFVEAMPHNLPGPIFNDLKPAIYETVKLYHSKVTGFAKVPDGWKLVPIEPTEEMREGFHRANDRYENGFGEAPDSHWRAMLNRAPEPQKQESPEDERPD